MRTISRMPIPAARKLITQSINEELEEIRKLAKIGDGPDTWHRARISGLKTAYCFISSEKEYAELDGYIEAMLKQIRHLDELPLGAQP